MQRRQPEGVSKRLDKPRTVQQRIDNTGNRTSDRQELVGPADHARLTMELHSRWIRCRRPAIGTKKTDATS